MTIWLNGEQRQVDVEQHGDDLILADENGETYAFSGMTMDENGETRTFTAEEMETYFAESPEVMELEDEDGHVVIYYRDCQIDITEQIRANGRAEASLEVDGETLYFQVTVNDRGDYELSMTNEQTDNAWSEISGDSVE